MSAYDSRHHSAVMRYVRPDTVSSLASVLRARRTCPVPGVHHDGGVVSNQVAEGYRPRKLDERISPVEQHLEELTNAAGQSPVLYQQQPQEGALFLRRASPVDGDGHELDVQPWIHTQR